MFENLVDFNSGKTQFSVANIAAMFENLVDFNSGKTIHFNDKDKFQV